MPQTWTSELYDTLFLDLPGYRTKRGKLDIPQLSAELQKSEEAIYRWFRKDNLLSLGNARALIAIANTEDNLLALAAATRKPPTLEDLIRFVR